MRGEKRVVMSVSVLKLLFLQRACRDPVFEATVTLSSIFLCCLFVVFYYNFCFIFFVYFKGGGVPCV